MQRNDERVGRLIDEATKLRWNRRQILKRAAVLGLSAPAISAVLAACGGGDDDDDETPAATTAAPADATEAPDDEASPEGDATEVPDAGEPDDHAHDDEAHHRVVEHRVREEGLPLALDVLLVALVLRAPFLDPPTGHSRSPARRA